MRKDIHKKGEPKARYRVRNWAAYNEGLISRGNVTIWIDEAVLARMPDAIPTRGRPCVYGDTLIQALLGVKTVYRPTLRALQGFTQSLRDLAFLSLPASNYTPSVAGHKRLMSNCRSFATANRSIWWSIAPV
ncbi:MAG: hypothetical protein E5299_01257 [Burkholderia gladioli]|nr:MAG: hypothetical protein E5299_01257 [Burkholderia gladioli]